MKGKFTPGPWRWEVNEKYNSVELTGGSQKFDVNVMTFERWGMHHAAPCFTDKEANDMEKAEYFAVEVNGRQHHASWFKGIDHPDAHLIAAAPDMAYALFNVKAYIERNNLQEDLYNLYEQVCQAVDKAIGTTPIDGHR